MLLFILQKATASTIDCIDCGEKTRVWETPDQLWITVEGSSWTARIYWAFYEPKMIEINNPIFNVVFCTNFLKLWFICLTDAFLLSSRHSPILSGSKEIRILQIIHFRREIRKNNMIILRREKGKSQEEIIWQVT